MNNNSDKERERAQDFGALFQEMKDDAVIYTEHRLKYFRLSFLEKLSKSSSLLALGLIIAFLGFSAFCFALMALAFFLGEVFNSNALGFGTVALFWLVFLVVILFFKEPIKDYFLNRTVRILYKIDNEENDDNGQEQ